MKRRTGQRGITLIETVIASAILVIGLIAVGIAMNNGFKNASQSAPVATAQIRLTNLQTQLQALTMYNAATINSLAVGQQFTVPAPPTPNPLPSGYQYLPSDSKPMVVTIGSIARGAGGNATLNVTYAVTGTTLTGSGKIYLTQKASDGCDSSLVGVNGTTC